MIYLSNEEKDLNKIYATTILCVRDKKNKKVVLCSDGQVTLGHTVFKSTAKKVRKIQKHGVLMGFAGSGADGLALFERLEAQLEKHPRQLMRACVELSKQWRLDKALRKLEAMMIVSDLDETYILSGIGDVMIPEHDVAAIGSGGNYALSAALALKRVNKDMDVKEIAQIAMQIAGETCIYTNTNLSFETLIEEDLKNIED
jgi:ATP-dependent HslUV protease subunit HslV